jgi:hypothetical protein
VSAALAPSVPSSVVAVFHRIGWEIREVSIDLSRGKAVVRLFRYDGRWLHLSVKVDGDATIERWHRDRPDQRGMGGSGPLFEGIKDTFLGRTVCTSARPALRALCNYVAENPAPGREALPASTVRDAVRLLMT